MVRTSWVAVGVLVVVLGTGGCRRRAVVVQAAPRSLRASELPVDERAALECALEVGRSKNLVGNAVAISVSKGPLIKGEPPDWSSGGEWTVRFVEAGLGQSDRDGAFTITVRTNPCRALRILVPG